jgi:hypothetical protein
MPTRVLQLGKHLNYETDTYSKEKRTVNIQTSYCTSILQEILLCHILLKFCDFWIINRTTIKNYVILSCKVHEQLRPVFKVYTNIG